MIKVENLSKHYGNNIAIKDINFEVKKGEIVGLLGKNGAGKTTTMNIITGYISATNGSCSIGSFDVLDNPLKAKSLIGYLPEKPPLYLDMTVNEYLDFCADLKDIGKDSRIKHLNEICKLVGIATVRGRLCKNLSKGYKQRVGLAQALVGNPPVLILDEPTIGLDPKQIIEIRQLIKSLGKSHTVIISSHLLNEISQICDSVIIIDKGSIVAQDTFANLAKANNQISKMTLRILNSDETLCENLSKVPHVILAKSIGVHEKNTHDYLVEYEKTSDARENIFNAMAKIKKPILMMKPQETTLEDIFLKVTNDNMEDK